MYTGTTEPAPSNGGNLPTNLNPINDFPDAIVIHGFPAVQPNRVEFSKPHQLEQILQRLV